MTTLTLRNPLGEVVEVAAYSATAAKNSFGEVMDRALAKGMVAITRQGKPRAVMLSMEEYEALAARVEDPLVVVDGELEALVERMQSPAAAAAGRALFTASPAELGRAARAAARRAAG